MTDPASPQPAPPSERAATPATTRWAALGARLKRFRSSIAAIAAFGAVLSGLVGYWNAYQTVHRTVPAKPTSATSSPGAGPLSIVVIPFKNLTGDPNQTYVADGLTASVTADLSRIRDAFIVDAATAFAYKDRLVSAQQLGKELGVHFVLNGGVQRSGTKIRINAQLADTNSSAQLWSETFEGDESDLFALQDRVTTLVGSSVGRQMVVMAAREVELRKSSAKVSDLRLQARAMAMKHPRTLKDAQHEEDLRRQALALEPTNAELMADLAASLVLQASNFDLDEKEVATKSAEGRNLALKAKELDPDNPTIYVAIGIYALQHGDLSGAQRAFETWISLEPKSPGAYHDLAGVYLNQGEPTRTIELITKAINLNPRYADEANFSGMAWAYLQLGDYDAAIEWALKAADKNPKAANTQMIQALAYALKGDDARARLAAAELRRLDARVTLSALREAWSANPPKYQVFFESRFAPAWRKAGLPE